MSDLNTIDEMLEILQGFKEGKEVQFKTEEMDYWEDADPNWNFSEVKYRLKPEPRAIEIKEGEYIRHHFENDYDEHDFNDYFGPAKFVEVLDE